MNSEDEHVDIDGMSDGENENGSNHVHPGISDNVKPVRCTLNLPIRHFDSDLDTVKSCQNCNNQRELESQSISVQHQYNVCTQHSSNNSGRCNACNNSRRPNESSRHRTSFMINDILSDCGEEREVGDVNRTASHVAGPYYHAQHSSDQESDLSSPDEGKRNGRLQFLRNICIICFI